jgi:hypothetical protein
MLLCSDLVANGGLVDVPLFLRRCLSERDFERANIDITPGEQMYPSTAGPKKRTCSALPTDRVDAEPR